MRKNNNPSGDDHLHGELRAHPLMYRRLRPAAKTVMALPIAPLLFALIEPLLLEITLGEAVHTAPHEHPASPVAGPTVFPHASGPARWWVNQDRDIVGGMRRVAVAATHVAVVPHGDFTRVFVQLTRDADAVRTVRVRGTILDVGLGPVALAIRTVAALVQSDLYPLLVQALCLGEAVLAGVLADTPPILAPSSAIRRARLELALGERTKIVPRQRSVSRALRLGELCDALLAGRNELKLRHPPGASLLLGALVLLCADGGCTFYRHVVVHPEAVEVGLLRLFGGLSGRDACLHERLRCFLDPGKLDISFVIACQEQTQKHEGVDDVERLLQSFSPFKVRI